MIQEALNQVNKRLPESADIFKGLSLLNPSAIEPNRKRKIFRPTIFLFNKRC